MDKRSGPVGQVDPAREGLNWYVYVDGNPARFIDPSGMALSELQCAKIREVLEYEKRHGTVRAACHFSNTFGDTYFGTGLGTAFDNAPIATEAGTLDLDWWTDLICTGGWTHSCGVVKCLYWIEKMIWYGVRKLTSQPAAKPYEDPKERVTIRAICKGYRSYEKLFPPDFMAKNCGNKKIKR